MQILILGGSGQTGRLVIEEALKRGHTITALVRNENSLESRPGLTLVQGSPTNQTDIEKAFQATPGQAPTVAICTLGQTRTSGNPWAAPTSPPLFITNAITNLIQVLTANQGEKIVAASANGTGDSMEIMAFFLRWIMQHSNMKQTYNDHNGVDAALKNSNLKFVLARSAMLKDTEAAPYKVFNSSGQSTGMMPSISRKSVAIFLVDAAERSEWDGLTPVVTN